MSQAPDAQRPDADDGASAHGVTLSTRVERLFDNYLSDWSLLPVVIAIAGHVAVVLAPLMLGLVRDGSAVAMVGLVVLGMLSVALMRMGWRIDKRVGMTVLVGGTWLGAVVMAWAADAYGVY